MCVSVYQLQYVKSQKKDKKWSKLRFSQFLHTRSFVKGLSDFRAIKKNLGIINKPTKCIILGCSIWSVLTIVYIHVSLPKRQITFPSPLKILSCFFPVNLLPLTLQQIISDFYLHKLGFVYSTISYKQDHVFFCLSFLFNLFFENHHILHVSVVHSFS